MNRIWRHYTVHSL